MKLLNIFNTTTWVYIAVVGLLCGSTYYFYKQSKQLDKQVGNLTSDKVALLSNNNKLEEENRVLTLTVDEFQNSNDKLIQLLDSVTSVKKVKKQSIHYALVAEAEVNITEKAHVPLPEVVAGIDSTLCDFVTTFDLNELTKIEIGRVADSSYVHTDISDRLYFWIGDKKVYRNKRKNFFDRLVHLDFKKDVVFTWVMSHDNKEYIKYPDIRVLKLK